MDEKWWDEQVAEALQERDAAEASYQKEEKERREALANGSPRDRSNRAISTLQKTTERLNQLSAIASAIKLFRLSKARLEKAERGSSDYANELRFALKDIDQLKFLLAGERSRSQKASYDEWQSGNSDGPLKQRFIRVVDQHTAALDAAIKYREETEESLKQALSDKIPDDAKMLKEAYHTSSDTITDEESGLEVKVPRYPLTGRPIGNMPSIDPKREATMPTQPDVYMPVQRYPSIYYNQAEKKKKGFCGTFYYIEPESRNLLKMGKTAIYGSKVHAWFELMVAIRREDYFDANVAIGEFKRGPRFVLIDIVADEIAKNKHWTTAGFRDKCAMFLVLVLVDAVKAWRHVVADNTPPDSKLKAMDQGAESSGDFAAELALAVHPHQFFALMWQFYCTVFKDHDHAFKTNFIDKIKTSALFPTGISYEYFVVGKTVEIGDHDVFDQDICSMARSIGIDTIVLQHEIGQTRSVSEILDTRDNSYSHLIQVNDPALKLPWFSSFRRQDPRLYPTIWFAEEDGFVFPPHLRHLRYKMIVDAAKANAIKFEVVPTRAEPMTKLKPKPRGKSAAAAAAAAKEEGKMDTSSDEPE